MNQSKLSVSDRKEGSLISSSSRWFLPIIGAALFVLACSAQQGQRQSNAASAPPLSSESRTNDDSAALTANLPLRTLIDVPLTGGTTRLDYQSLESVSGRLYIAHLGSDLMTVFDINK